jgi:EAL domain-containing protein (putative c-di-GMP-specific phosphodiesterase class I)
MLGTYHRLNLHVSASDREVVRAARLKIDRMFRRDPDVKEARKHFYRTMIDYHHKAQDLCKGWRL